MKRLITLSIITFAINSGYAMENRQTPPPLPPRPHYTGSQQQPTLDQLRQQAAQNQQYINQNQQYIYNQQQQMQYQAYNQQPQQPSQLDQLVNHQLNAHRQRADAYKKRSWLSKVCLAFKRVATAL